MNSIQYSRSSLNSVKLWYKLQLSRKMLAQRKSHLQLCTCNKHHDLALGLVHHYHPANKKK